MSDTPCYCESDHPSGWNNACPKHGATGSGTTPFTSLAELEASQRQPGRWGDFYDRLLATARGALGRDEAASAEIAVNVADSCQSPQAVVGPRPEREGRCPDCGCALSPHRDPPLVKDSPDPLLSAPAETGGSCDEAERTMSERDCKRAKSDMTPCTVRDGEMALANDNCCVGCGWKAASGEPYTREELDAMARKRAELRAIDETNGWRTTFSWTIERDAFDRLVATARLAAPRSLPASTSPGAAPRETPPDKALEQAGFPGLAKFVRGDLPTSPAYTCRCGRARGSYVAFRCPACGTLTDHSETPPAPRETLRDLMELHALSRGEAFGNSERLRSGVFADHRIDAKKALDAALVRLTERSEVKESSPLLPASRAVAERAPVDTSDWPHRFAVYAIGIEGYGKLGVRDQQICDDAARWARQRVEEALAARGDAVPDPARPFREWIEQLGADGHARDLCQRWVLDSGYGSMQWRYSEKRPCSCGLERLLNKEAQRSGQRPPTSPDSGPVVP